MGWDQFGRGNQCEIKRFNQMVLHMFILYLLLYSTDVCFYNVYERIELSNRKAKAYKYYGDIGGIK